MSGAGPVPPGNALSDADLAAGLEAAGREIDAGDPEAALDRLAPLVAARPEDPAPLRAAVRALTAAASAPERDAAPLRLDPGLARRLIDQDACPERPRILHHGLAALITSGGEAAAAALVEALAPEALPRAEAGESEPGLALFLLLARDRLAGRIDSACLSALHAHWLGRLHPEDLSLLHGDMFAAGPFALNRAELVRWRAGGAGRPDLARLRPDALLLVEWATGRPALREAERADLAAALAARLALPPEPQAEVDPAADRAGAAALLLRHLPAGAPPPETTAAGTGLAPEAAPLAAELAAARAALAAPPGAAAAARRLESRPRQAAAALAARFAALPRLSRRRPRVAVCVSGQLRGAAAALETWRRVLLPGADAVLFVHVWAGIGRSDARVSRAVLPFEGEAFAEAWRRVGRAEGDAGLRRRHPSLFAALDAGARTDAEALRALYDTPHVVVEEDAAPAFAEFSNQERMHYKIHAAHRLAAEAAAREGPFDVVLRLRPDLPTRLRAFDWADLAAACRDERRLWADKPFGVHYGKQMIGDQFAAGSPAAMDRYAETWTLHPRLAAAGAGRSPAAFTGHASLGRAAWVSGLEVCRIPLRFGPLRDPAPLPAAEIRRRLAEDAEGRMDAADRALLAAAGGDADR